ncbi:hypothetical protein N0V90_007857 [Kalmusia sp. IMI 367209]|nr:hypothetical protein N0V90_007857 [Kalmusia sp. IMI 367209]
MTAVSRSSGADYRVSMIWTDSSVRDYFTPIDALDRPDTRLSLLFMDASDIYHTSSVEDPWFSATTPITGLSVTSDSDNSTHEYFVAEKPTGVLGCLTQAFICNPELPQDKNCKPLYPASNINQLPEIWANTQDRMAVEGALGAMLSVMSTTPEAFYLMTGIPSLLAGFSLLGPLQLAKLPITQWQEEVEYNFQNVLASMQASMIEVATGKAPWGRMEGLPCLQQDGCRRICGNQVSSSDHWLKSEHIQLT